MLDIGGNFVAGEIHQTVSGGDLLVDFKVDSGSTIDMEIVLAGRTAPLTASDFVL